MTYTYRSTPFGNYVVRSTDGAVIPVDYGNADFIAYLAWVAAGNTPPPGAPAS